MAKNQEFEALRTLTWSTGRMTFDPERHQTVEDLIRDADSRMYERKLQRSGD